MLLIFLALIKGLKNKGAGVYNLPIIEIVFTERGELDLLAVFYFIKKY